MARMTRRTALGAAAAPRPARVGGGCRPRAGGRAVAKGRLKQSVSRWCYGKIAMPDSAKRSRAMGLTAIDLLGRTDWAVIRDFGLICSMG